MARVISLLVFTCIILAGCSRKNPVTTEQVVILPSDSSQLILQLAPPDGGIAPHPRPVAVRTLDESLTAGVAFLLQKQSPDGAWRSDLYATFKDGLALTPLVVSALQDAAAAGIEPAGSAGARRRGIEFLAKLAKANGTIDPGPDGIDYPVYTAAITVKIISQPDGKDFRAARDAWLIYLKERQLTAKLGWKEDEKQFGGWGYCRVIPQKPKSNEFAPNLIESNLSATVFALEALQAAGALDPETRLAAYTFVCRCQNFLPRNADETVVPDGGFHFIYDDPVRNKAGLFQERPGGMKPQEFYSYGSATADGLLALELCKMSDERFDDNRRLAAKKWLAQNFRADSHPGKYVKAHEPNREAVYYYFAASVSKAMREHDIKPINGTDWAAALATELTKRQRAGGSWANPVELVRENELLVATSNAVTALAHCLIKND